MTRSAERSLAGPTATRSGGAGAASSRLTGAWLLVTRIVWVALFAIFVVPFALALPKYRQSFTHPSPTSSALSPGAISALARTGISLDAYGWIALVIVCALVLTSVILSLVIFWRRSDDWMALLVSLFITIYPIIASANKGNGGKGGSLSGAGLPPLQAALAITQSTLPITLVMAIACLFPNGRFAPRWSWILVVALSAWALSESVQPAFLGDLFVLGYPVLVISATACMVYRYRRVSTPVERTQTRWIIAGFVVTLIGNQLFWLPSFLTPLGSTLYPPIVYQLYLLSNALVPVTFFIAFQRYRLYDIDTIINRTLVYGSLTAILIGLYAGGVIGAQALIRALAGSASAQTPLVTVATTLIIATLVSPLRRRIQQFIDHSFYRTKYNAAQTLAAFGATLRSEIDLPALTDHLVTTVDDVMRPAHISLWLAPTPARTAEDAPPLTAER